MSVLHNHNFYLKILAVKGYVQQLWFLFLILEKNLILVSALRFVLNVQGGYK